MKTDLNRMIDALKNYKPEMSRVFFHYCRKDTLEKLFNPRGEIYCTHTARLNDKREIFEGCELFLSYLQTVKNFPTHVIKMLMDNINANINRFDPLAQGLPEVMPWTFSVSEAADAPFQWKYYTDSISGGYMLAIDKGRLLYAIDALNKANTCPLLAMNKRSTLLFLPCLYIGVDDVAIRAVFEAIYSDMKESFEDVKLSSPSNKLNMQAGINVLTSIFLVSAIIKREKFRHEREWRIVLTATKEIKLDYEQTVGKPCLRTYISAGLGGSLRDLFVQVMCSPQGNQKELISHAQWILKESESVLPVHTSHISNSVVVNYISRCPCAREYEDYVVRQTTDMPERNVEPYEIWRVAGNAK